MEKLAYNLKDGEEKNWKKNTIGVLGEDKYGKIKKKRTKMERRGNPQSNACNFESWIP